VARREAFKKNFVAVKRPTLTLTLTLTLALALTLTLTLTR